MTDEKKRCVHACPVHLLYVLKTALKLLLLETIQRARLKWLLWHWDKVPCLALLIKPEFMNKTPSCNWQPYSMNEFCTTYRSTICKSTFQLFNRDDCMAPWIEIWWRQYCLCKCHWRLQWKEKYLACTSYNLSLTSRKRKRNWTLKLASSTSSLSSILLL